MKLKGGVIIIGSLYWEDHFDNKKQDNIRKDWREQNLISDTPTFTKVPIRYGRKSGKKRKHTYTMVFSSSCENSLGQGIILPFNTEIISFEGLELQAIALARAEGIYRDNNSRLSSDWGSVALLINPVLMNKDFASGELIKNKWSSIYHKYSGAFFPENYKINSSEKPSITYDGFLNILWQTNEMKEFDLLIATPVVPEPKSLIEPLEIAQQIFDNDYSVYFDTNREKKIFTTQDDLIQAELDKLNKPKLNK